MRRVIFASLMAVLVLALTGCATAPHSTSNACAIFSQKDGFMNNWRRATQNASRKYGVPMPIIMATIYTESSFKARARPPRTKLLGFIPWKRPSTAYGYSQALNGTWKRYKRETGNWGASRSSYSDAVDFIGWYHRNSSRKTGVSLSDPYNLYLVYHSGVAGYKRGAWRSRPAATQGAARFTRISRQYSSQLRNCSRW